MSLPKITIYTTQSSARLRFVLDWLFKECLGFEYDLVHEYSGQEYLISYGTDQQGIAIPDAGLLWEQNIKPQNIKSGEWNKLYTLYNDDAKNMIPFDLLSSIFYLFSRYEEYNTFTPDKHERYPHTASILYKEGVLERPVIDEWVEWLRRLLEEKWKLSIPKKPFIFELTYDIDIAWSYKNKGLTRWLGAAAKEIFSGKFSSLASRLQVAVNTRKDPYDAFETMSTLHQKYDAHPRYFILSALNASSYDKNISPEHPAMIALINDLQRDGETGIHPSYYTKGNVEKFITEKKKLEQITGKNITTSRQHFIRLFFPDTYRMLLEGGITDDYSMGYSTALGFRAGTSNSFYWYDLQREQVTSLRIHPFCFMDTTAFYDLGLSTQEAMGKLEDMKDRVRETGGTLTTIFHNFSLGTDKEWEGWSEAYEHFVSEL